MNGAPTLPTVRLDRLSYYARGASGAWLDEAANRIEAKLIESGWSRTPGSFELAKDHWKLDIRARLVALVGGSMSADQWAAGCNAAGIGGLEIELPLAPARHPPPPQPMVVVPNPLGEDDEFGRRIARWGIPVAIAVVAVMAVALRADEWFKPSGEKTQTAQTPRRSHVAPQPPSLEVDGRSNLPGDWVILKYKPKVGDYESFDPPQNGMPTSGYWALHEEFEDGWAQYGVVATRRGAMSSPNASDKDLIAAKDNAASTFSTTGARVRSKRTKVDGHVAYVSSYWADAGHWMVKYFVLTPRRELEITCTGKAKGRRARKRVEPRCAEIMKTARIKSGA